MEKTNSHSEKVQCCNLIENGGKSACLRFLRRWIRIVVEAALLISLIVMGFKTQQSCPLYNAASCPMNCSTPSCLDGWIGYRGKCYYFSEAEGNWTYSQSHCSALGASLAVIDSRQDLEILTLPVKASRDGESNTSFGRCSNG